LRSGSCSGVCPQARSCSHVRRRTWWHANRASLHRGGEGAAHRYSAPARPYLATRKLCLAASPRRRDGAQLLLLVYAYAWCHRDIKQLCMCVHSCAPDDVRAVLGRLVVEEEQQTQCSCATRTGRHAGCTQPLACVHAHLETFPDQPLETFPDQPSGATANVRMRSVQIPPGMRVQFWTACVITNDWICGYGADNDWICGSWSGGKIPPSRFFYNYKDQPKCINVQAGSIGSIAFMSEENDMFITPQRPQWFAKNADVLQCTGVLPNMC